MLGRLWRNAADAVYDDTIIRKVGALPPEELANVEAALRVSLALVEAK